MILRLPLAAALGLLMAGTSASAKPARWIDREFREPGVVPTAKVEQYLNEECRPSGLDGIHTYGVQAGHDSPQNLHIVCRHDGARARYKVSLVTSPPRGIVAEVGKLHDSGRVFHLGPFHFSENGGPDGILVIEKAAR